MTYITSLLLLAQRKKEYLERYEFTLYPFLLLGKDFLCDEELFKIRLSLIWKAFPIIC